mmetsp:Transcript_23346/g.66148  ORF Transcript_23346/g.66148 Transcript_23346/m.66148 type:complete len:207 (+) Transcript_23346:62-682(+)
MPPLSLPFLESTTVAETTSNGIFHHHKDNNNITTYHHAIDITSSQREVYEQHSLRLDQSCNSKKHVQFANTITVHPTLHIANYTQKERQATWYTRQDLQTIKLQRKHTISEMERSFMIISNSQHDYRGLESKTKEGSMKKRSNVTDALFAVLDEQDLQDEQNVFDPIRIAQVYMKYARKCQYVAQSRAINDRRCVEGYKPMMIFQS